MVACVKVLFFAAWEIYSCPVSVEELPFSSIHPHVSVFHHLYSLACVKVSLIPCQVPMLAAKGWQEEETLQLIRRNYAAKLWEMIEQPPLDNDPVIFPGVGKWKDRHVLSDGCDAGHS